MNNKSDEFQLPTGRRYKSRQNRDVKKNPTVDNTETKPKHNQSRTSNRSMISVLLNRYEQMARRRFGDDIDQTVDLKQLLLDCFHYDLNILLKLNTPYTHLDELVQLENKRKSTSHSE